MSEFSFDNLSEDEKRYDDMLLSILQREGKIEPFLECVFKFLYRRTDFYLIQETDDQPYGFPPTYAKQLINKLFQKYDSIPKDKLKERLYQTNEEISKKSNKTDQSKHPSNTKVTNLTSQVASSSISSTSQSNKLAENADITPEELLKKQQKEFQNNPSSYNGAIRDKYTWTQTIKDIDVRVKIDSLIKTSKDVKIKIEKGSLQVSTKNTNGQMDFVINDNFPWKVKPDESTWSLFPGDHIHIYLEKTQERWWENLLEKEPKLDLRHINPEKPIDELDQESQAKIKQLMFDDQQKKRGLPTSEEQQQIDMLKKAWDAENSPFKGQPFDPSVLQNNNNMNPFMNMK